MPLYLRVADFPDERLHCNYSVMYEVLSSLRVLDNYQAYPLHINWSLKTLRKLPRNLNQERNYFKMLIQTSLPSLWDARLEEHLRFGEELAYFREQALDDFTTSLISQMVAEQSPEQQTTLAELRANPILQEHARLWIINHFPDNEKFLDDLLDEPQGVKDRFTALIEQYWTHQFSEFWTVYEPHFLSEIQDKGRRNARYGMLNVLKTVGTKGIVDRHFQYARYDDIEPRHDFTLTGNDTLILYPSYFTYPNLNFRVQQAQEGGVRLSIMYPMKAVYAGGASAISVDDLAQMLKAISDPTRLQILRLVAQTPRPTRDLAQQLKLSEPAVSKHLKLLKSSGWVTSERNSYYVLYRASTDLLPLLNRGLEDVLNI